MIQHSVKEIYDVIMSLVYISEKEPSIHPTLVSPRVTFKGV